MTYEEYKERLKKINSDRDILAQNLVKKFVEENKKFSVGDIIADATHTILITSIRPFLWAKDDCPMIYYRGDVLTKKLEVSKRGDRFEINEKNARLIKAK